MPKIVNIEEEKENIINAFQNCILEMPLSDVSVRIIAKRANISHSKIFSYFKNKNEIIITYANKIAEDYSIAFRDLLIKYKNLDKSNLSVLNSIMSELFEIDPNNIIEKLYAQIYVLGQYDDEIKSVVLKAYDNWRKSLKKLMLTIDNKITDEQIKSILILIEGIMIYRMNDNFSAKEAKNILNNLIKVASQNQ
ncbi:TetR/AcrR family transcriptional regulator [Helcococcus ovis]|uniref:TetR/AcrR family transcriptional regulator n=1 Tax=Helcococcus ovis TaxID=72026 RepID=A0A4R9C329_9FIRM|nr:TetR/AcrR family transcriptional regulator [Helcococcus ovis]TFF65540.1 TetR/AcrR family transcriptional regulator [Helcococcus ovis]TFF67644.1 TetR/AcrR family transcriptional regulator [Helcococcus ovis]TFF68794.1 TetR/AcrR family transcriptional regulator [Helcococcus ovis]WNZ01186.1 TetR/AcrR family transcriptional regulator [Helcococcus ovis]